MRSFTGSLPRGTGRGATLARCIGAGLRARVGVGARFRRSTLGSAGRCGTGRWRRRHGGRAELAPLDAPRRRRPDVVLRVVFVDRVALRLTGPRTGTRSTKTQPTCGTGLPPINRPSSNSHSYSPWNSWKESLDNTAALALSAMPRTNASPRPTAPAGGATSSLLAIPCSNSSASFLSIRWPNVASTTTVTRVDGFSSMKARTASLSWLRLGIERPSVAMFDPSTTTCFRDLRPDIVSHRTQLPAIASGCDTSAVLGTVHGRPTPRPWHTATAG